MLQIFEIEIFVLYSYLEKNDWDLSKIKKYYGPVISLTTLINKHNLMVIAGKVEKSKTGIMKSCFTI